MMKKIITNVSLSIILSAGPVFAQMMTPMPQQQTTQTKMTYMELPDIVLGSESAPVTLVEYSSLDCGHCAHFHQDVLPVIKKKYVDKGLVRIVYRHFPLDGTSARAMAVISKLPQEKWFEAVTKAYQNLPLWINDVTQLGVICGIDKATCEAAIKDTNLLNLVVAKRYNAEKRLQIEVTPSFELLSAKGNEAILKGIKQEELLKKIASKI